MPRGYRSLGFAALVALVFVCFGLGAFTISLGYPEQQERNQSYQGGDKNKIRALLTVTDFASSGMQHTPCKKPQSEAERDLCEQWRAANAAEKSAQWAVFGVIASIVGISLLLWQIMLTREAVKDTGDATKAMREANLIAERAQRPWLDVEIVPKQIMEFNGVCIITLEVTACNIGQTVAENVSLYGKFFNPNDLSVDITTGRFKGLKGVDYRKIYEFWRNTADFRQYHSYVTIPRKKEKFICGVQSPDITDISHEIFVDERDFISIDYAIHFEYTSNGGEKSHNFQSAYRLYFKESELLSRGIKRSDLPVFADKFVVETSCYGLID